MPKIKQKIVDQGKSIQWLADGVGTTRPVMSYITHGKCLPTPKMMEEILKLLDCKIEDIFSQSELNFNDCEKSRRIRAKIERIQTHTEPTRPADYNWCVRLRRADFSILTKTVLKECGFRSHSEFMRWAVDELEKKYSRIKKREQALFEKTRSQLELEKISDSSITN